jgi:PGF-CTERM protein
VAGFDDRLDERDAEIDHDPGGEISETTINFSVNASETDTETGKVTLYRPVDGEWVALESRLVSEVDGVARYEATTPGFSVFAIGADESTDAPVEEGTTDDETPGFGLLAVGVALVGLALLIARRD